MVSTLVLGGLSLVPLIALSAFFSSSETAIFSLPAEPTDGTGPGEATALSRLRADPHRLLVTLLLGNNIVNIAISSILTLLVAQLFSPTLAVVVTTVLGSTFILVFGEIVPKAYGLGHAASWSERVAGPLSLIGTVLSPLVWAFDRVTRRLSAWVGGDGDIEEPYIDS